MTPPSLTNSKAETAITHLTASTYCTLTLDADTEITAVFDAAMHSPSK